MLAWQVQPSCWNMDRRYLHGPMFGTQLNPRSILNPAVYSVVFGDGHPTTSNVLPLEPLVLDKIHCAVWLDSTELVNWWHHPMEDRRMATVRLCVCLLAIVHNRHLETLRSLSRTQSYTTHASKSCWLLELLSIVLPNHWRYLFGRSLLCCKSDHWESEISQIASGLWKTNHVMRFLLMAMSYTLLKLLCGQYPQPTHLNCFNQSCESGSWRRYGGCRHGANRFCTVYNLFQDNGKTHCQILNT